MNEYYFMAEKLKILNIDEFSGSLKTEGPRFESPFDLIKFSDMNEKNVNTMKVIDNNSFAWKHA